MPGSVSHPPLHTAMVCSILLSSDEEDDEVEIGGVDDDTDDETGIDTGGGGGGGGGKSGLSVITKALSTSTPLSTSLSLVLL